MDLDPGGHISPWYVPNNNCVAYYFPTHSPRVSSGFSTPPGFRLTLRIVDNVAAAQIDFEIPRPLDHGKNQTSSVSIPYNGSAFEGAYTQVEWQPCCSSYPISSYFFNGSLAGLTVSGGNLTGPMALPASYMLPVRPGRPALVELRLLNVPAAGYAQVG